MSKLLFVFENDMPTVSMMRKFWTSISNQYNITSEFVQLKYLQATDIDWCDVLVLIRPNNIYSPHIAQLAHHANHFVITFCDDDLMNMPSSVPNLRFKSKGFINSVRNSDLLMSTSPYLIQRLTYYTRLKRSARSDTIVMPDEIVDRKDVEAVPQNKIKFVFAGSDRTDLLNNYIFPAINKYAALTTNEISLTFISSHPDCANIDSSILIQYIDGMPLNEYRKYMESQQFDIGLAPLCDSSFSKCKYFNKYIEFSLTGIVGIYSNVEPYTYVVKDRENGFLANNDVDSWFKKICEAADNIPLRISCSKNAQTDIRERFNESTVMENIIHNIPELVKYKHNSVQCKGIKTFKPIYKISLFIENLNKIFFYIKNEGVRSLLQRVSNRIMHRKAYN